MKEQIYKKCSCGSEVLNFHRIDDDIYVSIYSNLGQAKPKPWKTRFWVAWNLIKSGEPYDDQLILKIEDTKDLIKELREMVK